MTEMKTKLRRPRVYVLTRAINDATEEERIDLAAVCGTELGNLRQIAYGYGSCSLALAKEIVAAVDGVSITDLIPELAGVEL